MEDETYRSIISHVRSSLLECDMDCDTCSATMKNNCRLDMKTAIYEILDLVEQLYTLIGIVAMKQGVEPEEEVLERKVEMFT